MDKSTSSEGYVKAPAVAETHEHTIIKPIQSPVELTVSIPAPSVHSQVMPAELPAPPIIPTQPHQSE